MRMILKSLVAYSILMLAASPALAGGGMGFGGCFEGHQQVVQSTPLEQDIAMSTFDGDAPVAEQKEQPATEMVCVDGDASCQNHQPNRRQAN